MKDENSESHKSSCSQCPHCDRLIPQNVPSGLCPTCIFEAAASSNKPQESTPPPSIDELSAHFLELEIQELIGVGGMGAVYLARQTHLDRQVALKILHVADEDPAFEERFNREALVLGRLNHPNIVSIYDFGITGPYHYLIMEFVDGVNLRQAMHAGRFSSSEALSLVQDLCDALKSAHDKGIFHRDIKPENILIDVDGRIKIADFGIAKIRGANDVSNMTLTLNNSVMGSLHYMAPEQMESPGDVDERADIYSLGVILYELLTGKLPIGHFAVPSQMHDLDSRIDEIVVRTLAREREARFQSAEEFKTSVSTITNSPPQVVKEEHVKNDLSKKALKAVFFSGITILLYIYLQWNGLLFNSTIEQNSGIADLWQVNIWLIAFIILFGQSIGAYMGYQVFRKIKETSIPIEESYKFPLPCALNAILLFLALIISCIHIFLFPVNLSPDYYLSIYGLNSAILAALIGLTIKSRSRNGAKSYPSIWPRFVIVTAANYFVFLAIYYLVWPLFDMS